jgi:hypothetical protein
LLQRFQPGQGGGAFVISPTNQVLLSRSDNLARINLDGSAGEIVIPFEFINTASEYVYYPQPQSVTGQGAFVTIPDARPWEPGAAAALWQVPVSGPAIQLGAVDGNYLFSPVVWSQDGSRTGYVQQLVDFLAQPLPQLIIGERNGENGVPHAGGDLLRFHAWRSSTDFLYSGAGYFAIGRPGNPPHQFVLPAGREVAGAEWLINGSFLVAVGFPESGNWELRSGNAEENFRSLASLSSDLNVQFDVWLP